EDSVTLCGGTRGVTTASHVSHDQAKQRGGAAPRGRAFRPRFLGGPNSVTVRHYSGGTVHDGISPCVATTLAASGDAERPPPWRWPGRARRSSAAPPRSPP